jgi:hypothetical protein
MITLPNKLSKQFITEINNNYNKIKNEVYNNNKNINYINVYHKDWKNYKNNKILKNYIDKEISCENIITIGYISAPPDCNNQYFHLDYAAETTTYFIPLIELTDLNGTEYLNFYNKENNNKYKKLLLSISDKFIDKNEIIEYLKKYNLIYKKDYNFKYVNAKPYSIIFMDSYILHRGRKNITKNNRIMFQIVCGINKKVNIIDKKIIKNSYLDEDKWCEKNNFKEKWCKKTNFFLNKNNINSLPNYYKIIGLLFFILILIILLIFYISNNKKYKRK